MWLLILAISVVYGEWVSLVIVSAWLLGLRTSLLYRQRYLVVSLPSNKSTYRKSLWIRASAKSKLKELAVLLVPRSALLRLNHCVVRGPAAVGAMAALGEAPAAA